MTKRSGTHDPPVEHSDEPASEYDAFEKLTKDLLTVGKKQLDDAVAREKAKKD
jgi:hypothetical protein